MSDQVETDAELYVAEIKAADPEVQARVRELLDDAEETEEPGESDEGEDEFTEAVTDDFQEITDETEDEPEEQDEDEPEALEPGLLSFQNSPEMTGKNRYRRGRR